MSGDFSSDFSDDFANNFSKKLNQYLEDVPLQNIASEEEKATKEQQDYDIKSQRALNEQDLIQKKIANDLAQHKLDVEKENTQLRKKYANHIFCLTCAWAFLIFVILFFQGFSNSIGFVLSDKVIITLITSTTINFFGFFLLVVKYLFHIPSSTIKEKNKGKNLNKEVI